MNVNMGFVSTKKQEFEKFNEILRKPYLLGKLSKMFYNQMKSINEQESCV